MSHAQPLMVRARGPDLSGCDLACEDGALRIRPRPGQAGPGRFRIYRAEMVRDADGRHVCTVPDLPGTVSDGPTREAALDSTAEAVEAMQESMGEPADFVLFSTG